MPGVEVRVTSQTAVEQGAPAEDFDALRVAFVGAASGEQGSGMSDGDVWSGALDVDRLRVVAV